MVRLRRQTVRTDGFDETGHSLAVFLRDERRRRGDAFIRLAVREIRGFVERQRNFVVVENVEQHRVAMSESEHAQMACQLVFKSVEIRHQHHHSAAFQVVGGLRPGGGMVGDAIGVDAGELRQHGGQRFGMLSGGRLAEHLVRIDEQADLISLPPSKIRQAGGQNGGVGEFGADGVFAFVGHGGRCVQNKRDAHVRLLLKDLHADFVLPREKLPIHILEIIAGHIAAVLEEFSAIAAADAAVRSCEKAFDGDSRHEREIADAAQESG